ncbi:DUF2946 family protein [Rhizobium sp. YJ-22]|uniref:DUF2946 family protein n=1 Tax=Rhizobium sp. YJ-22 TaxID=3037556 RepID=UPI00321F6BE1
MVLAAILPQPAFPLLGRVWWCYSFARKKGDRLLTCRWRRPGTWVAFVAAYMLVLQSLLTAFAVGAMAAPRPIDAFGGIICTSHGDTKPSGDGSSDRHDPPDCCMAGCAMLSGAPAPRGADALLFVGAPREIAVVFREYTSPVFHLREGRSGNPRAPPAAL